MEKEELIKLVERLQEADYSTEEEGNELMHLLKKMLSIPESLI